VTTVAQRVRRPAPEPYVPGRDVLLLVAADRPIAASVDAAVSLARQQRSLLHVLMVTCEPSVGVDLTQVAMEWSRETLRDEALAHAGRLCQDLIASIPTEVPVRARVQSGRPERLARSVLAGGLVGTLVVDGRWSRRRSFRRATRSWCRSGIEVHAVWSRQPVDIEEELR
jgi:hypothetical protein